MSARTVQASKAYRLPHIGHFAISESRFHWWGEVQPEKDADMINGPVLAAQFWRRWIQRSPFIQRNKEHLVVVPVNTKLRALGWHLVSMGTLNETSAHPREILRPVIVAGAHSFLMMHNHPSGDTTPSDADRRFTALLLECCQVHRLNFADHVIVGDGTDSYFSFREARLLDAAAEVSTPPKPHVARKRKARGKQK